MSHFFRHLGKVIVGCVAVLLVSLFVLLLIGFFVNDAPKEYVENMWQFLIIVGVFAVGFSIPAWRWRKEIWADVASILSP